MQLLISMISTEKYFKKTLILYTSSKEALKASWIRDGFFPFSLSSVLTLGTILVTRSLFHFFFFQKELW